MTTPAFAPPPGFEEAARALGLVVAPGPALDPSATFEALRAAIGGGPRPWASGSWQGRDVLLVHDGATTTLVRIAPPLGLGLVVAPHEPGDGDRPAPIGYPPFDERLVARGDDHARIVELLAPKRLDGMSSADQLVALATRPYRVQVTDSWVALGSAGLETDAARLYERLARSAQIADRLVKKRGFLGR